MRSDSAKAWITRSLLAFLLISCTSPSGEKAFDYRYRENTTEVNAKEVYNRPYVLLISIDGYRPDYTDLYQAQNLKKFRDEGASARALLPVFPTKTFTNHYSIITGLYADHHGIVANYFYDPERKEFYSNKNFEKVQDGTWYKGTPIWVAAQKQGMLSGTFFWPGSEAKIQGMRPSYSYEYYKDCSHDFRVKQVVRWLQLPPEKRPHFLTLYFPEADTAGHHFGPHSQEVKEAVKKIDQTLGVLFAELKKLSLPLYTIVVSDHGMQEMDPKKIIYLEDLVDLKGVIALSDGPQALLYSEDQGKIKEIEKTLKKKKHPFRVYKKENMPREFHYAKDCPRCGDLMITVDAPYALMIHPDKEAAPKGAHGFDGDRTPSMQGIFYAQGPKLKKKLLLNSFRNIHVYPLILHILGLKTLSPIDGDLKSVQMILKD